MCLVCEHSDSFVIKEPFRSRVKIKICVCRSTSWDSTFEIAPFKVGIFIEFRLGEVLEPQIPTIS